MELLRKAVMIVGFVGVFAGGLSPLAANGEKVSLATDKADRDASPDANN